MLIASYNIDGSIGLGNKRLRNTIDVSALQGQYIYGFQAQVFATLDGAQDADIEAFFCAVVSPVGFPPVYKMIAGSQNLTKVKGSPVVVPQSILEGGGLPPTLTYNITLPDNAPADIDITAKLFLFHDSDPHQWTNTDSLEILKRLR